MELSDILSNAWEFAIVNIPNFLLTILVVIVGLYVINKFVQVCRKQLTSRGIEQTLAQFLVDLLNVALKVLLLFSAASMLGIETTSFLAVLSAVGLAIGLSLQGSLSNFAGGVLLLLFQPLKVGDLVEAQGFIGHIKSIDVLVTKLLTPDHKTVIVPNGPLASGSIKNFTRLNYLRVDLVIGISYDASIQQAREVILKAVTSHPKVKEVPSPSVSVLELADSSVNLAVRPYTDVADYWDVYFDVTEEIKYALDEAGIEIPYPQKVEISCIGLIKGIYLIYLNQKSFPFTNYQLLLWILIKLTNYYHMASSWHSIIYQMYC